MSMAPSLTSSTFSSLYLHRFTIVHTQHQQPDTSLSLSKPLKFSSIKAMASGDKMKEGAGQIIDGVKEGAIEMKDKASDVLGKTTKQAVDMKDKAFKSAQETTAMTAAKVEEGKNNTVNMAMDVKDKSMDAAGAAMETTEKTVAGAWNATKGAVTKK